MKEYLKLLRVRHYIKNILIFVPLFFGKQLFEYCKMQLAIQGFLCFCLMSSAVYILNDLRDIEKDRKHPAKKNRPLASGKITITNAKILLIVCILSVIGISFHINNWKSFILLMLYLGLNIAYSIGLKNKPIIDVAILASGFVIRLFYGGLLTRIEISKWLYLIVTTGSLYMGLGKRRNELKRHTDTREVLHYYTAPFLDKNMYVCLALTDVFYAFWTLELPNPKMVWTVPAVIIILMYYSLDTEGDSDGDPVEVLLKDRILIGLVLTYTICLFLLLYVF